MRALFVRAALTVTAVALVLFAVPLAVTAQALIVAQTRADLQQGALRAVAQVGPNLGSGDPIELPAAATDFSVGVYGVDLRLRAGVGAATADSVTAGVTQTGRPADGYLDGQLVVAVPVVAAEQVIGTVRASVPESVVWRRVLAAWLALAVLAGLALAGAVLVARRRGRIVTTPLEQLAATAEKVSAGDLGARAPVAGGAEIERVARTQNAMLDQLTGAMERERRFSADTSHQLRTPLTGLQLGLELALQEAEPGTGQDLRPRLREALALVTELDARVAHLLQLARAGTAPNAATAPVQVVVERAREQWHATFAGQGRRLVADAPAAVGSANVAALVLTEVLAVLLDNAARHGRGQTMVTVRDLGSVLGIDVADEGQVRGDPATLFERGSPRDDAGVEPHPGMGLPLARTVAHTYGGRLSLASANPTRFTLLLPRADPEFQLTSTASAANPG